MFADALSKANAVERPFVVGAVYDRPQFLSKKFNILGGHRPPLQLPPQILQSVCLIFVWRTRRRTVAICRSGLNAEILAEIIGIAAIRKDGRGRRRRLLQPRTAGVPLVGPAPRPAVGTTTMQTTFTPVPLRALLRSRDW